MRIDLSKRDIDLILDAMGKHHEIRDSNKSQGLPASTLYWKLINLRATENMADWISRETAD